MRQKFLFLLFISCFFLVGCSLDYDSQIEDGSYSYACSKREAFLYEYRWDGTEEAQTIVVPDQVDDKRVTAIGGFYGRGLPMLFQVNLEYVYHEPDGEWLLHASKDDITETKYLDFDLRTDIESDEIQLGRNIYYHKVGDRISKYIVQINIKNGVDIYSNIEAVQELFPDVEIERAYYEIIPLGEADDRVPGPTDYKYVGVITLEDDYKNSIISQYELEPQSIEIDKNLAELLKLKDKTWESSEELNHDLKPLCHEGSIYVSEDKLYFELMRY